MPVRGINRVRAATHPADQRGLGPQTAPLRPGDRPVQPAIFRHRSSRRAIGQPTDLSRRRPGNQPNLAIHALFGQPTDSFGRLAGLQGKQPSNVSASGQPGDRPTRGLHQRRAMVGFDPGSRLSPADRRKPAPRKLGYAILAQRTAALHTAAGGAEDARRAALGWPWAGRAHRWAEEAREQRGRAAWELGARFRPGRAPGGRPTPT